MMHTILIGGLLFLYSQAYTATPPITSYISLRSPRLSITTLWNYIERTEYNESTIGTFTIATSRTSRPDSINQLLFGTTCPLRKATFIIAGSQVTTKNNQKELLADNYGLSADFMSTLYTQPRIKTGHIEFIGYVNLDSIIPHLYAQIQVPFTSASWDLKFIEKINKSEVPTRIDHERGTHHPLFISQTNLFDSFSEYITGTSPSAEHITTVQPLQYAKINTCGLTGHSFSEIMGMLGYDIYTTDHSAITFIGRATFPVGTRPTGIYLFEPIIGNGHQGQLGIGITGYWRHHLDPCEQESFVLYFDCSVDHLFTTTQRRTFDLKNKPLSRYILALQHTPKTVPTPDSCSPTLLSPSLYTISPVANFTNLPINVSTACQTQLTLMCTYEQKKWTWMAGYNLFLQTPEKITLRSPSLFDSESWTLINNQTTLLTAADIDLHSAQTKKVSNTLFSQVYYTGTPHTHTTPFIGFGGSLELGNTGSPSPSLSTPTCHSLNSALSTWEIWVNIGFSCH